MIAAAYTVTPAAFADSTRAHCDFYSHGNKKEDRSGPCTVSQRQGYVDIRLENGQTFDLNPARKANHYTDQDGHEVVRKQADGGHPAYHWHHKAIVVSSGGGHHSSHSHHNKVAVKDMARYCAGEASSRFNQRPANITTQHAIRDQGMYSVFGQYPPSGSNPQVFICTFTAEGAFVGVDRE